GKTNATHGMLPPVRTRLPSASDVSKFSEEASKNVKLISTQISDYTGDKHSTAISVLTAIGNVHWVSVGFLLVASVLERLDKLKYNKMGRLKLLKSMNELAKVIMQLQRLPHLKIELQAKMNESIQLIVDGAILCCVQKKRNTLERFYKAATDGQDLEDLRFNVDEMHRMLHLQISFNTYDDVHSIVCSRPPVPYHNSEAVGIEHKITEVIKLLEWDDDKPAVVVVVHGIGGAGKTTLANEVYASLNLQGWKHSKVTVIKNLELHPNIEDLQSQILQDLTGIKHTVRDCQSGQQELKSTIEKEIVFIYMDNILKRGHLESLLPKEITGPKKLRILVTARKTTVSGVFESCGIKPCKLHLIESLSVEASLQLLCRKIDREKDTNFIVSERPQAKMIAQKLSCCPLFVEVVGAYLRKRNNKVEAYEKVCDWLRDGEDFSCDKEDGFDESRILFAYHELRPSAQEAFLDICSFFSDWEWDEVACIVGQEELDCLQEGALIKRVEVEKGYEFKRKVGRIHIHDLMLSAGRKKSKDNRFRSADDFSMALKNEEVLHQTRGVWLKCENMPYHVSAEILDKMSESLRIFAMGDMTIVDGQCIKRFDKLKFLQVGTVPNLAIDILKLEHLNFLDCSFRNDIWSPPKNLNGLQVLKLCSSDGLPARRNIHVTIEFGHLNKLKHLALSGFHIKEISSFLKVYSLHKLKLSGIQGMKELPGSLGKLQSLQELYLLHCMDLKQLPTGFGEMNALTTVDLQNCNSLQELPCDFDKLLALQSLNLSHCSSLLGLPEGLGNLPSLTYINVYGCALLISLPHRIAELSLLRGRISFDWCSALKEIPEDICKLTMLTSLSLQGCKSLRELPVDFNGLTCLEELVLDQCESLQGLCTDFRSLVRLKTLNMSRCKSLKMLPVGFSELTCLQELVLKQCESLQELCNDFHCLVGLRRLNMSGCKRLSRLPQNFGKLGCLERLVLSECDKLEELSDDFGCLGALQHLTLSRCKSLSKLPDCFGKLDCLKTLNLSGCDKLEELCTTFSFLRALKYLTVSRCKSLSKLPDCFGQLGCLERLDLSMCSKLEELSSDFHCLSSLIALDLSNCESLGGKWMDSVGAIQSLWRLNIAVSESMIQWWMEMQRRKEEWHFVVVTDPFWERTAEGNREVLLRGMISKMFDEEGLLIDIHQRPFCSSSVLPDTNLVLIIHSQGQIDDNLLAKIRQPLASTSKVLSIIYVGRDFSLLPSDVTDRILAYTPPNSRISLFFDKFCAAFPSVYFGIKVFCSSNSLEGKGIKCPSIWQDISYILNEVASLISNPRESNVEILKAVLQSDFLLNKSQQVKVADLQGKVILLLYTSLTMLEMRHSVFKDVYIKMQGKHRHLVEVVWIPCWNNRIQWDEFKRAVADAPWPVIPNPWLILHASSHFFFLLEAPATTTKFFRVVVVDSKGRISNKDALPMIERWGLEAYPFSQSREEELRKSEWENAFNYNQFVFQNLDFTQTNVREASSCREMMLLCVGEPDKMLEFITELDYALEKLKGHFQVFNAWWRDFSYLTEADETKIRKICTIPCISLLEACRFWQRIQYLCNDLTKMGEEEQIVQVRRMVFGLVSAEVGSREENEIRVIVVDKNGEMVSGKGKEVVEALWQCGENDSKLLSEIKIKGVRQVLKRQWKDGIVHPEHHSQHLLLRADYNYVTLRPQCSVCSRGSLYDFYQCSVCGNYVACDKCINS
ncbi:hypothetical protein KI387_033992, partial [Taxus chinensis]